MAARNLRSQGLTWLVRQASEDQRRFPLQLAMTLSQQFAGHGLQFFKVNKTVTHVSVARPHFLDLEITPVSEGVKRIVEFINAHAKTTRRKLMEALAPTPAKPAVIEVVPAATEPAAPPAQPEPTAEQTAVISDLHWLIHQGHVIEFADGRLETAKKPLPKPPKPEKKPQAQPVAEAAVTTETVAEPESMPPEALPALPEEAPASPEAVSVVEDSAAVEQPATAAPEPVIEPPTEATASTTQPEA
jgi:hypothetical protein